MNSATHRIRVGSWSALVLCFFLPFCRGCEPLIPSTPYRQAFGSVSSFVTFGAPFLYPVALLIVFRVFRLLRQTRWAGVMATGLCAAVFIGLTWLVGSCINSLYGEQGTVPLEVSMLATAFVFLWGIMALGLRRLEAEQLLQLFSFQCAAISFCWLLLLFNVCSDRLIGAWGSLVSNITVVGTYVFDSLNAPMRKHANEQT